MSDFVTREEIAKGLANAHQNEDARTIDRMVEQTINETHGSQEAYEKHLAEYQERKEQEYDPNIDEELFEEIKENFERRDIVNPEHAARLEFEKANMINLGYSPIDAETRAYNILLSHHGDSLFEPGPTGAVDPQIAKLEELGFQLNDSQKAKIQAIMKTKGINAAEAMREVGEGEGLWNHIIDKEINAAGTREDQYYDALTKEDKRVLHGLKAAMPEANWTAQKFYKREHGKALPKPKREEPTEPMVPRSNYNKLRDDFCRQHGIDPDDFDREFNI